MGISYVTNETSETSDFLLFNGILIRQQINVCVVNRELLRTTNKPKVDLLLQAVFISQGKLI